MASSSQASPSPSRKRLESPAQIQIPATNLLPASSLGAPSTAAMPQIVQVQTYPANQPRFPQKMWKTADLLIDRICGAYTRDDARRDGITYWPAPLPAPDLRLTPDPLILFYTPEISQSIQRTSLVPLTVHDLIARRKREGQKPLMQIPLGLVDKPELQQQEALLIDLHGTLHGGPLLVLGTQNSGKATTLQTILLWLCSRYLPEQFRCAVLDPLHDLDVFRDLPHLHDDQGHSLWSDGATDDEVSQFVQHCMTFMMRRKERYAHIRWNDETMSQLWAKGHSVPLFLLVVSNYQRFADRVQATNVLKKLALTAAEARAMGIYLILTSSEVSLRYIPPDLMNKVGTRISLFLNEIQRADFLGRNYPMEAIPGRGLFVTRDRVIYQVQLALPTAGATETVRFEALKAAIQQCSGS